MTELTINYMNNCVATYTVNKYAIEGSVITLTNINIPDDQSNVPMGSTLIVPIHSVINITVKPYSRTANIL